MIAPTGANASLILPNGPLPPAVATANATRCGASRKASHSWSVKSFFVAIFVLLIVKYRMWAKRLSNHPLKRAFGTVLGPAKGARPLWLLTEACADNEF